MKDGDGSLEPLAVGHINGQMLPVFSFEEEAELFLWFEGLGNRWRVRLTGCGELISVLYGPCARVRRVALDPLPQMVANGTATLVSLDRHRFLDHLMGTKT